MWKKGQVVDVADEIKSDWRSWVQAGKKRTSTGDGRCPVAIGVDDGRWKEGGGRRENLRESLQRGQQMDAGVGESEPVKWTVAWRVD